MTQRDLPGGPERLTPEQSDAVRARQVARARVMGLFLGGLAILFFAITVAKIAVLR